MDIHAIGTSFGWNVMPVGTGWSWNAWYQGNSSTGPGETQEQAEFRAVRALDKLKQEGRNASLPTI